MRKLFFTLLIIFISNAYADLIDPTQPSKPDTLYFSGASQNGLELNAILSSKNHPMAIINGDVLHLNDTVTGYKLITIKDQSVILAPTTKKGEPITLTLNTLDVKKPHVKI